jgi:DNA-binding winged helix-turn-helix (wHTH) protein
MNIEELLTILWNKISKPITNILIGAVFLVFAPKDISLVGWIFLAIGSGGFLDKNSHHLSEIWKMHQKRKKIKEEISNLTASEDDVLRLMVQHNKQIMRKRDFESVFSKIKGRRSELPENIYDIFRSLDDKNIIIYNFGWQGYFDIKCNNYIWDILKRHYKNDFNSANKREEKIVG